MNCPKCNWELRDYIMAEYRIMDWKGQSQDYKTGWREFLICSNCQDIYRLKPSIEIKKCDCCGQEIERIEKEPKLKLFYEYKG